MKVYHGGFHRGGKGTPIGDGKDEAMREIADACIGEFTAFPHPSSTKTSIDMLGWPDVESMVIMLARNGALVDRPLMASTKALIHVHWQLGCEFVVGDMPRVDSQYHKYLDELGADYHVYHTGATPRI